MADSESKNRRVGRVVAKHRTKEEKFGIGGIFSPFPGAYSLGFALKNEDGSYDNITAIKTQSGKKLDLTDFYLNLYVNETLVPYDKD
jgi:hypothetical protein